MGFRKNPAALKAKDKQKWLLPAPEGREQYFVQEGGPTKAPNPLPSYTLSEPEYDARISETKDLYSTLPAPSRYGPHFEKGPSQEEIWDTRKTKDVWRSEKKMDEVPFREEFRNRAHSFHQPRQNHQYSDPYEKRPKKWTDQMEAEGEEYHRFCDMAQPPAIGVANKIVIGRKNIPTLLEGEKIKEGISMARASRLDANRGGQARQGFIQKYPQAYEENGIRGHDIAVTQQRQRAARIVSTENALQDKYEKWDRRMVSTRTVQPRR